ncbi:MAG: hypothetical protein PUF10_01690 [Bacteroidales bacterium]|nr:hypothetical protein [Bacteroidales bacterium]
MKKFLYLIAFALIIVANGCAATGTALVTGIQRPATDPNSVVLYTEIPNFEYEVIGIVNASSDACCSDQDRLDYAVEELKCQAAKIGANGIILENVSTSNRGGVISYGVFVPVTSKNLSGKAIYVQR